MQNKKFRVALYPRVSSIKQVNEGDSIDSQIFRLKKFCEEKDYEIVKIYTDSGKSASLKDDKIKISLKDDKLIAEFDLNVRPAFKEMLEDCKKVLFDGLVFFKWDRFSRNAIFGGISQIYLKNMNVKTIPSDDDNDPLVVAIRGALNEDESRKIKQRVNLIWKKRFEEGVMPGKAPFGYKWNKKKKLMEVDLKRAEIVKQVFNMTLEGKGYKEICERFKIKPQSYYNILKNKVYVGIIEYDGEEKIGIHEHLISKETYNKVNGN